MNKIFLIDKNTITYSDLIDYINLNVLNAEYTEWELFVLDTIKKLSSKGITDYDDLINSLYENNKHIELLSSGTTGTPKLIYQSFKNMVRNISISVMMRFGLCFIIQIEWLGIKFYSKLF